MKKLLLGIVISTQTPYGCINCAVSFREDISRMQAQAVENRSSWHDEYQPELYYETFTKNIFENTLDGESRHTFEEDFMKITQTKVGRTLLGKIFDEIQQPKRDDKNAKLRIISGDMGFAQEDENGYATLRYSTKKINACTIDLSKKHWYSSHLKLSPDIEDNRHIHLFHELCHWYHFLRNPGRKQKETDFQGNVLDHHLSYYYFHDARPSIMDKRKEFDNISTAENILWGNRLVVPVEEIRTILGAPQDKYYEEGDELCENLYRYDIGAPLRFGHVIYNGLQMQTYAYKADVRVIRRVIKTCKANYKTYK